MITTSLPKKAMLFAAGLGTRLRPLTTTTPKPLIEVGNKPLIAYALETLKKGGVEDVILNTHHLAEQIQAKIGDGSAWGLRCHYSHEPVLLGTGGGLLQAKHFFDGENFFWTVNSDTLLDIDLRAVWAQHLKLKSEITLVTHSQEPPQFGGVWIDPHTQKVLSFLQAPSKKIGKTSEVDFCGVSLLKTPVFTFLEKAKEKIPAPCLIRNGFVPMLGASHLIHTYSCSGYFNDVGTLERLEEARRTKPG